ncbi:MAG TPA: hypothetical protein PKV70_05850, partial [Thermodesulfobacteriota bacterium]|nr:hypothetical protein [Thermodesulfobacteriota bacterium]
RRRGVQRRRRRPGRRTGRIGLLIPLALIVDDPDAPRGTWVRWVVRNILPGTRDIQEDSVSGLVGLCKRK